LSSERLVDIKFIKLYVEQEITHVKFEIYPSSSL
jgi:hypothetical protein